MTEHEHQWVLVAHDLGITKKRAEYKTKLGNALHITTSGMQISPKDGYSVWLCHCGETKKHSFEAIDA